MMETGPRMHKGEPDRFDFRSFLTGLNAEKTTDEKPAKKPGIAASAIKEESRILEEEIARTTDPVAKDALMMRLRRLRTFARMQGSSEETIMPTRPEDLN